MKHDKITMSMVVNETQLWKEKYCSLLKQISMIANEMGHPDDLSAGEVYDGYREIFDILDEFRFDSDIVRQ